MENYFDNEIKRLERELLWLKTSSQKSSSVVPTVATTVSLNISLALNAAQTTCSGAVKFKLSTSSTALSMVTLDHYYDDITKASEYPYTTRAITVARGKTTNGDIIITVNGRGTTSDVDTLKGGGSVVLNVNLTVRCTDEFSLERI